MKVLSVITILTLIIFAAFPGLDLATSRFFYSDGSFAYREHPISMVIYLSVRIFCILSAVMCLGILIYDPLRRFLPAFLQKIADKFRNLVKFSRKQVMFMFLVIVLTPGILVHWVMKPVWERARPVNVIEFGGDKEYTNFYHLFAGQDGKSFPSGHASMAFSIVALAYMVSESRRRKVLALTLIYGVIASTCRVWQGGHFVSDVTFSALLTLWTILLLKKFYLDKQ